MTNTTIKESKERTAILKRKTELLKMIIKSRKAARAAISNDDYSEASKILNQHIKYLETLEI